jgi:hypothetical protein
MVTLKEPYLGYTIGELTGKRDPMMHWEIKLPSGRLIFLYEDEFERQ